MASTDAKPIPRKNTAYRVTFPIWDADGDLVTGAAGLDSEVSKDGGTFADCTNEATEIATASGMYYLDLTSTEMNADTVAIIVKTSTSGAKTTPLVLYPEEAGDIRVNVTQISDANVSTSSAQLGVNVVTNGDKTGYALSSAGVQAIWDALTSALTTVGSIGKLLVDNVNATISSRSTYAGGDTSGTTTLLSRLTGTRAGLLDNLDATISSRSSFVAASDSVTVGTNNDKTGYSLSSAGIQAIWDKASSALTTAGSIGKLIVDNLNATVSSRLASASYTAAPTANENADALLDRTDAIETSLTPRGALRLAAAALAGKLSGAATTSVTIRNAVADSKARITATVDADGNRTAVTTDVS